MRVRRCLFLPLLLLTLATLAAAADVPLDPVPGLIVPKDLPERAARQAAKVAPLLRQLQAERAARPLGPSPTLTRWDWSARINVPVIQQGSCGSCWACASACVLSYVIEIQTGRPANVSAQDILDCSGEGSCRGGWVAFEAGRSGYADATAVPYTGRKSICRISRPRPHRILAWTYLAEGGGIPPDAELKKALCETGPIWVGVNADGALSRYRPGEVWASPERSINHAVVIVGWDDDKGGWIVRNSWGAGWGDKGNFLCKYGSNIGEGASVAWAMPSWIDPDVAARLEAEASTAAPPCCDDQRIDGPESAPCGTLVKLAAPDLPGARYTWRAIPDRAIDTNVYMDSSRRVFIVATPCVPGRFWFSCSISTLDTDPLLLIHGLTVEAGPSPPGPTPTPSPSPPPGPPGPSPTPGPAPAPVVLDSFGEQVRDWAAEVPAASRQAAGEKIAAGFASVVAGLRDGSIATLGEAQARVRGAYSSALRGQVRVDWEPFWDRLTAAYLEHRDDLADADVLAKVAEQIAAGVRAALQMKDQPAAEECRDGVCPAPRPAPAAAPQRRRGVFGWR